MSNDRDDRTGSDPADGHREDMPVASRVTRRSINRGAAVGSAVLLSVGSRVAWGTGESPDYSKKKLKIKTKCISQGVWESYSNGIPSRPNKKQEESFKKFEAFRQTWATEVREEGDYFCAVKRYYD